MRKLNKETYVGTTLSDEHAYLGILCDCCHERLEGSDYINIDVKYISDQGIPMSVIEDEVQYMGSYELEHIEDSDDELVESFATRVENGDQTVYCDECFDVIDKPNSENFDKILDLLFEKYPEKGEYYKPIISEWIMTRHSGSSRVMNEIIVALYYQDYFSVKLDELGVFDTGNYDMVVDWLWEFAGISINTMKAAANRKSKLLGHSYAITLEEDRVNKDWLALYDKRK